MMCLGINVQEVVGLRFKPRAGDTKASMTNTLPWRNQSVKVQAAPDTWAPILSSLVPNFLVLP
jgi:hypothetical protein